MRPRGVAGDIKVEQIPRAAIKDIRGALAELVQLKQREWKLALENARKSIALVDELAGEGEVQAEIHELSRIVSNLINNAMEALGDRGEVVIKLLNVDTGVLIEVIDNGHGIPKEIAQRLLKEQVTFGKDKGHGLGLWNARKRIEGWAGTLTIHSREGSGTKAAIGLKGS